MMRTGRDQEERIDGRSGVAGPWWRLAAIGAVALAGALGLLALVYLLARPFALLFAAVVIAQALAPLVARLEKKMPRTLSVVLVYLLFFLLVLVLGALAVPPIVEQARQLAQEGPQLLDQARQRFGFIQRFAGGGSLGNIGQQLGKSLATVPLTIFSALGALAFVVVLSAYWLIAMPALRRFALSFFPPDARDHAGDVLGEVGHTIGGFVRGSAIDAVIQGSLALAGYLVIGLDFALVLALVAGLGAFVPVVGSFVAALPAVGLALLESPTKAVAVAGFYLVLQQVEGNILLPNIMRKQADIPPLLSLFAIFAGGAMGGILGAIIAVPFAAALRVLFLRVVAPAMRRWPGVPGGRDRELEPTTVGETER